MCAKIYKNEEWLKHQVDIQHEFHDSPETFEVYECPKCKGHFLVESHAMESISVIWCPYCKEEFND